MNLEEVRAALAAALGSAYSDRLWEFLVDETGVEDESWSQEDIPALAARAYRALRLPPSSSVPAPRNRSDEAARLEAISVLLAADATIDPDVTSFRNLIGGVVDWPEIDSWLDLRAAEDGRNTRIAQVPIPDGTKVRLTSTGYRAEPALTADALLGLRTNEFAYIAPGVPAVRRRATRVGGLLDELRRLGARLAMRYGWEEAQATTWILTGITPAYASMAAVERLSSSGLGVANRIILAIDPAVPARDVAAFYRQVRGDNPTRALKRRHSVLATFVAQSPTGRWAERMSSWNRQHPEWAYQSLQNFKRDAAHARRRLLRAAG